MASEDKRYNGWANYETWNVKLWMDNEEGSWRHYQSVGQEVFNDAVPSKHFTKEEQAALDLSDRLKDEYEEALNDWLDESGKSASVWADLSRGALSEVNWHEIAVAILETVDKTGADDDTDVDADEVNMTDEEREAYGFDDEGDE